MGSEYNPLILNKHAVHSQQSQSDIPAFKSTVIPPNFVLLTKTGALVQSSR